MLSRVAIPNYWVLDIYSAWHRKTSDITTDVMNAKTAPIRKHGIRSGFSFPYHARGTTRSPDIHGTLDSSMEWDKHARERIYIGNDIFKFVIVFTSMLSLPVFSSRFLSSSSCSNSLILSSRTFGQKSPSKYGNSFALVSRSSVACLKISCLGEEKKKMTWDLSKCNYWTILDISKTCYNEGPRVERKLGKPSW